MKILLALHGYPPLLTGGTERTVEALARAMHRAGHAVTVVSGTLEVASTERVDVEDQDGVRVLRLHRDDLNFEDWWKSYHPGISATLRRVLAEEQPDVVHVHHWLRLTSDLARLGREAGARVVVTLHDYFSGLARSTRFAWESGVEVPGVGPGISDLEGAEQFAFHRRDFAEELRAAHVLTAPSRAHADRLRSVLPVDPGAVAITPPPLLRVPPRLKTPPRPGGRRLLTWGSLYEEKGLEVVLRAMRAAGPGYSLTVLGEAHQAEYQEVLTRAADGLAVDFRGRYDDADLAGVEADYAVLPSLCDESYGLVVDEAQALGLPMLCSDLPAYREHCDPDAALWIPPGDVDAWTAALTDGRLATLQPPRAPQLVSTDAAAAQCLALYASPDETPDGSAAAWARDPALEHERLTMLFRRAERRLHSMHADGAFRPPPDEFLAR